VTAFIDPAAEFALRFDAVGRGEGDEAPDEAEAADGSDQESEGSADATAEVVNISQFRKKDDT
jgi:hypothetical protein